MANIDFTVNADSLPQFNFEEIAGEHYLNRRTITFLTCENNNYYRYEVALEIENDTLSTLLDTLEYGFCKAQFYADWSPASLKDITALCVRSGVTVTAPIKIVVKKYTQVGALISYTPYDDGQTRTLNAGVWRPIWLLDFNTSTQVISEINLLANTKSISTLNVIPIPAGSIVQHYVIDRNYFTNELTLFDAAINGVPIEDPTEYSYGDISVSGGGAGGSFDNTSDTVDFSVLPTGGGASASGLVTMFHPTASQMAAFGSFLWGGLFNQGFDGFLTSLKKWVNDPIESIVQLSAFPVTPPTGSARTVKFCGIASDLVGEGVSMNVITSQFMTFDFGSITVPAYWKQALDYTPYSKVSIFLPFCGIQPLNADDIIDATLHLKYNIDLLTGIFSAELKVVKNINGTPLNAVLYNWSGNMAVQIPITASNFSQVFGSLMSAVAGVGIGAISGGLGAAAAGAEASKSAVVGGALTGAGHGLASNIGNVINSKPHVQHSGRLDGSAGALSSFTPYLIIERPVQSLSAKFQSEQGYPSNIVQTLGDLEGMTVCEAPILDGIECTDDEKTMINNLLCGGVII